ncbi:MAG TPA: CYTH domain-containing protein, partial [Candidatus Nanopelagicales bacterium]|nr:CYTH domain-containing protein [Candidatus Nanopelagicales bacterium]
MSAPTSHREVEFKFRVPETTDLDVRGLLAGQGLDVVDHDPRSMTATYFDTPRLSLLRWGITLRTRQGGGDDGWHMKVPAEPSGSGSTRDEIRVDSAATSIPSELASLVSPLTRRQELQPMAVVRTQRRPFVICDASGLELIEVVDDFVDVDSQADAASASSFHEVEVELLVDTKPSRKVAAVISRSLIDAGARPSSISKAAQALGAAAGDPPDVPALPFPDSTAPAIDALQAI